MNRRDFVGRVTLGAAAACTALSSAAASSVTSNVNIRFVGMMGFIQRRDRSYLIATPGQHAGHHMTHVPFLMARKGSAIARAFNFVPVRGVVPAAFDTGLIGSAPSEFVYRPLQNTAIEVISGDGDAVTNHSAQMAQMHRIAPGKRVRGNIEKWATSTISLRGGRIENSSGHPDAGKLWTFGSHTQRLTDAVNFRNEDGARTTLRLTSGTDAVTFKVPAQEPLELWMFSAATMESRGGNPTKLTHGDLLFDYLVDAQPVPAECPDATGRTIPETAIPFADEMSVSNGIVAGARTFPPDTEICFLAEFLLDLLGLD